MICIEWVTKMRLNPFKTKDFMFCPECGKSLISKYTISAMDPWTEAIWVECPTNPFTHYSKHSGYRPRQVKFDPTTGKEIGD